MADVFVCHMPMLYRFGCPTNFWHKSYRRLILQCKEIGGIWNKGIYIRNLFPNSELGYSDLDDFRSSKMVHHMSQPVIAFYCGYVPVLYHFWYKAVLLQNRRRSFPPRVYLAHARSLGWRHIGIPPRSFRVTKLKVPGYSAIWLHDDHLVCFNTRQWCIADFVPGIPCTRDSFSLGARRIQHHAAGVLACARRCSDATAR